MPESETPLFAAGVLLPGLFPRLQANSHTLILSAAGDLLKGSCEGETFAATLSSPAYCGRSVVHRRLGSRGWSLGH